MNPWTISAKEICQLQGDDDEFGSLITELLRASMAGHLPASSLRVTINTRAPDGGVDLAVDGLVPAPHDPAGLLTVPTCWQLKASPTGHIKPSKGKTGGQETALREEVCKPHVQQLLGQGYGYRFCIADSLTPQLQSDWTAWLSDEVRKNHPSAPPPVVVTADIMADWCSRFAGVVRRFRPLLTHLCDFRCWDRRETSHTPNFVELKSHQASQTAIRAFADFSKPADRPVLVVSGAAGVGKTRCLLEALRGVPGCGATTVVADDEGAAVDAVTRLANEPKATALLVVDGMAVSTRSRVNQKLKADTDRLRVIAIDNERAEEQSADGEIRLEPLTHADINLILDANFPAIGPEIRLAIADLTDGFVRLAVDVCRHLPRHLPRGEVAALAPYLREHYLAARLIDEQRGAVELVSLAARVGYSREHADELRALCAALPTGYTPERVLQLITPLRYTPGFVAVGARYLYVTPRVIAQAAFRGAWERWVRRDPSAFLSALPDELRAAVGRQIRDSGTEEIRRTYIAHFANWIRTLHPAALSDLRGMAQLFELVDVDPTALLPRLCDLIEAATDDDIAGLDVQNSSSSVRRRRSARRELVELTERFLRFPELFPFSERILYRLAVRETEQFSNNATGIWCQAHRPLLSGTPIPFADRIALLERRLGAATTPPEIRLCCMALAGCLSPDGSVQRSGSASMAAGRIPPPDWRPETTDEWRAVWQSTANSVERLVGHPSPAVADAVLNTVINNGVGWIRNGFLPTLARIVEARLLTEVQLAAVFGLIDRFLLLYCSADRRHAPPELEQEVRDWRRRLDPASPRDRIRLIIRRNYRSLHNASEDHSEADLRSLAEYLHGDMHALDGELPWLFSAEALGSYLLGTHLGRLDSTGGLLEQIVHAAVGQPNPGFVCGYVVGLLTAHPSNLKQVTVLLDSISASQPGVVYELLRTGLTALDPIPRTLSLVDEGKLPVVVLIPLWQLIGTRSLTSDELKAVTSRLLTGAKDGNAAAREGLIEVLCVHLYASHRERPGIPAFDEGVLPLVREALTTTASGSIIHEGYRWAVVLKEYGLSEREDAVRLTVMALGTEGWLSTADGIGDYLTDAAASLPEVVLREIGASLLNKKARSNRLYDLAPVVAAIPFGVAKLWVEKHGLDGARAIAPMLPKPRIVNGATIVPEFTLFVLDTYGHDEEVSDGFRTDVTTEVASGDIVAHYDRVAADARIFRTHPNQCVRKWAERAEEVARWGSRHWRLDAEDDEAP